ncbi:hypothetical protein Tco_1569345 [Tanacetum coccineum]
MASLDHRLNPLFSIKECSSCRALYTRNCGCSKESIEDKILVPKPPQNYATCGDPVDGLYCRSRAFVRKCLNEGWYTIHDKNEILNTSEPSDDNTNIVSAPQEPFVFNQGPGQNSSRSPPHIDHHCCYECGDSLNDIFCQRCTCKSCGKGAHYGYNCPPQIPIISNPEPCYNQNLNEILQNLQSSQQQSFLGTCQQCGCNEYDGVYFHCTIGNGTPTNFSTPYSSNDSLNFPNHPPQLQYETNICKLCGNDAHFGYDCSPQVPFVYNQDPCFNQNFDNNFPQTSPSFPQQCLCCENCGGPHATFQCQPMNQDFYNSNLSGFDQFQPPQFPVNYPPQETSKEILQAQEDLMEAIQAFLKEYDHIPPNEKCMALLLAEERFLKIKQTMEEEQNQPEVMQELLLKLMDDLQILKGSQQEKKETAAQSFTPYWNFSMIDDEEARDNFLKDVCTFLRKFSRIPFGVTPKVILIAWESFGKIKDALMDKQYQQEDIQELMSKLLEDVRNISEEFSEYINCPSWNRPLFYFDNDDDEYTVIWRRPKAITPEEPEDPLIMQEEELNTIPEKDKFSVEDLVQIPSGSKSVSDDICNNDHSDAESLLSQDILITSPKIDFLFEEFAGELAPIPPKMDKDEFNEEEYDCYDDDTSSNDDSIENIDYVKASPPEILSSYQLIVFEDVNLRDKCQMSDLLITKIGRLSSVVISDNSNDPLLELPEFESFHFDLYDDPSFPRPPPESTIWGDEIDVEDDDSFTFVIQTFLPFLTYFVDSPFLYSFGSEDTIFDPGIST